MHYPKCTQPKGCNFSSALPHQRSRCQHLEPSTFPCPIHTASLIFSSPEQQLLPRFPFDDVKLVVMSERSGHLLIGHVHAVLEGEMKSGALSQSKRPSLAWICSRTIRVAAMALQALAQLCSPHLPLGPQVPWFLGLTPPSLPCGSPRDGRVHGG